MRRTISKIVATVIMMGTLFMRMPVNSLSATTISDVVGETSESDKQDPVKLINLSILRGINIKDIKYKDKTIIDVLTQEEKNMYAFSDTTLMVYSEAMGNARIGIQNGWSAINIIDYADDAYKLYNDRIAMLATTELNAEEVETVVKNYIVDCVESNVDIGNIEQQLPLILSDYSLRSIIVEKNSEENIVNTNVGEVATTVDTYKCIETSWYTNSMPLKALINGTVSEITDTSISTVIGGDNHKLTITYESNNKLELLNKNQEVGTYIEQNTDILSEDNGIIKITIKYNDEAIDLLSLLGPTGKILVNEYKRTQAEPYDANRDEYITQYLKTHI